MSRKIVLLMLLAGLFFSFNRASGQNPEPQVLKGFVDDAIQKGYAASVRICVYDTVRKMNIPSYFSGVVVSKEGHILTVAHGVQAGKKYVAIFPDGKEVQTVTLGRMALKDSNSRERHDLAMLKIDEPGEWPVAQMGWSSSLKVNMPCISISYPALLNRTLPTVRFGRILRVSNREGFVHSTCKMEPGDSGGPLFDYMGRVIALHSSCGRHEDENFEVPIDSFRKYWSALNTPEDYKSIPEQVDEIGVDPFSEGIISLSYLENLNQSVPQPNQEQAGSSVKVTSLVKEKQVNTLGTLFHINSKNYVVSKYSLVGADAKIISGDNMILTDIVHKDAANDLVVLQLQGELPGGLTPNHLTAVPDSMEINFLGKLMISPLPQGKKVSIVSINHLTLPRRLSAGYFGASAQFRNEKIILNRVAPKSPADSVRLKIGDQITGINGRPISRPEEFGGELSKYNPGDSISVECVRADSIFTAKLLLTLRPVGTHAAERFDGGKSVRVDGFKKLFAHDANIKSDECGGPVFDAEGNFYGINIARFSRTTTLAIPADVIRRILSFLLPSHPESR